MKRNWNIFLDNALSLLTCKELVNWLDWIERKRRRTNIIKCLILWWLCAYYQSTASHKWKGSKAMYLCQCVALINAAIDNIWMKRKIRKNGKMICLCGDCVHIVCAHNSSHKIKQNKSYIFVSMWWCFD